MKKSILFTLFVLLISQSNALETCSTDADCDHLDGPHCHPAGFDIFIYDYSCRLGYCRGERGAFIANCETPEYDCQGSLLYETSGYCDSSTVTCKVNRRFMEDCDRHDKKYCDDPQNLRIEDWTCGYSFCKPKSITNQYCPLIEEDICVENQVWSAHGYCNVSNLSCEIGDGDTFQENCTDLGKICEDGRCINSSTTTIPIMTTTIKEIPTPEFASILVPIMLLVGTLGIIAVIKKK